MRIGIDLGGTKTELIALDESGKTQLRLRKPTPAGSYTETIALIRMMVLQAESELQCTASVGIGTPGAASTRTGLMKNCNSTCLNGRPLQQDLELALGREVRISNDANCFALSEAVDGAARDANVVFGVILGTGVGGSIIAHRQVLEGINRIGGEWGHNPLPTPAADEQPGPACYCGRYGCIETWLSGPGMSRDHDRITGNHLTAERIAQLAGEGDAACAQTMARYLDRLARALAGVINILDPDVIVLGGGLSNIDMLYEQLPLRWGPYIFSDSVSTSLLPPMHGDSSGVRGAAWLWGQ
ncbi:ROK family protein [Mariprofundus erugo]|uniref:ROK family protein n=1 Tax=Mariprofundus erugo TaxID=2528639 RepID=UPI0010FEF9D7|nr:ROK family protein [Mariprofundus erugo]TLS77651.1 ROK family protein [Mariprofundus erugo]